MSRGFLMWFKQAYADRPEAGAAYLFECCRDGGFDSIAWDWLERTGDETYSPETFLKAAKLIISEAA